MTEVGQTITWKEFMKLLIVMLGFKKKLTWEYEDGDVINLMKDSDSPEFNGWSETDGELR